jgi:hypothetical protein
MLHVVVLKVSFQAAQHILYKDMRSEDPSLQYTFTFGEGS